MMEKRELICIGCPMGCPLTVEMNGTEVVSVTGNTCPRGDALSLIHICHAAAREKGLIRLEGKDYVVQDGDIMLFRFNV